ncbi:MAG: alpha/beta hydrolase [Elainellaceae cyanobacterium]
MLQFQPAGFGQRVIPTSLGIMAYYTPVSAPWSGLTIEGQPQSLVFLHSLGGGSSAYEWSKVYPAFAANYRVIAPDLIGWGQSSHPAKPYRSEDYFALFTELLEAIDPPACVVASSLTAGLTVRLAIQRPDLFQMLFLVSPAGYGESGANYGQGIAAQVTSIPGLDRLIYTLGAANEWAVRNFLENFLFADRSRVTNEMVAAYLASAQQFNAEHAALSSLRGDICFDLEQYIEQLQTPTFVVWGEKSRFGRPELAQRLANLNSKAIKKTWTIANVGVLPHLETPATVIGLLQYCLSSESSSLLN